jgi:hypothetical protein
VQSAQLATAPPSVVAGDVLRDSAGAPTALAAFGFGGDGRPLESRARAVRLRARRDAVDGGARHGARRRLADRRRRATLPFTRAQGRVAAVVGDRLQVVQTLQIVPTPDSLAAEAFEPPVLRYDCTDPGSFALAVPDTGSALFQFNTVRLPAVTVRGDSAGRRVAVRSRLVRWDVDSGPFAAGRIPRVALVEGGRDSIPAVAVVAGASDVLRPVDTTGVDGASTVRLRIRPAALGRDAVPAREFTVRVRARGQPGPRPIANGTVFFRVRLARTASPLRPSATCP